MRVACSSFSFHQRIATGDLNLVDFVSRSADCGIEGVEFNDGYILAEGTSVRALKLAAARRAMDISALAIEANFFKNSKQEVDVLAAGMRKWLEVCYDMGAPILRVNTAQPADGMHQVTAPGVTFEMIHGWAVSALRGLCEEAAKLGIVLGMENHYGLTRTSTDTLQLLDQVGADNLYVNIDTGNFWADLWGVPKAVEQGQPVPDPFEDPYQGMARMAPRMIYAHCKIFGLRDGREAVLDYSKIMNIFRSAGYDGYLSLENLTSLDPFEQVPRQVALLKAWSEQEVRK